jgi:hypothetical protein
MSNTERAGSEQNIISIHGAGSTVEIYIYRSIQSERRVIYYQNPMQIPGVFQYVSRSMVDERYQYIRIEFH